MCVSQAPPLPFHPPQPIFKAGVPNSNEMKNPKTETVPENLTQKARCVCVCVCVWNAYTYRFVSTKIIKKTQLMWQSQNVLVLSHQSQKLCHFSDFLSDLSVTVEPSWVKIMLPSESDVPWPVQLEQFWSGWFPWLIFYCSHIRTWSTWGRTSSCVHVLEGCLIKRCTF